MSVMVPSPRLHHANTQPITAVSVAEHRQWMSGATTTAILWPSSRGQTVQLVGRASLRPIISATLAILAVDLSDTIRTVLSTCLVGVIMTHTHNHIFDLIACSSYELL
jgi:hypothetical protein